MTNCMVDLARYRELIESALAHNGGSHTYEDIVEGVEKGLFVAWPGIRSIVVCQLLQLPRVRIGHCFLAAGEMEEVLAIRTWCEEWARRSGCNVVSINGRPGWERLLASEGYSKKSVVLEKQL